jgi:hypothetical protein
MLRVVALLMLLSTRAMADLPERWIATAIDVPNTIDVAVADLDDEDRVCGWVRVMVDGAPVNKPFFWYDGVATVEDTGLDDAHSYLLDPTGRAFGIAHDPNLLIRVGDDKMYALAELGDFTGTGELVVLTRDFTLAGNLTGAGFVWTPSHGIEHLPGDRWNKATIAEASDALGAVGTVDLNHGPDERAFRYVPQGGGLMELQPGFAGSSRALAAR